MKKRLLSALLALSVLVGTMPVSALAETQPESATPENAVTEQEETQEITASFTVDTPDADLPDNNELFAMYLQQQMYPGSAPSTFANWGEQSGVLNEKGRALYDQLKALVQQVAEGQLKVTQDCEIPISMSWTFEELGVSGTGDSDYNAKFNAAFKEDTQFSKVFDCLLADCPEELYWFDKTRSTMWGYNGYEVSSTGVSITGIIISLPVAEAYRSQENWVYSFDQKKAASAQTALAKAAEIVNTYADRSDYEKLAAYKHEICQLTDYNYNAAYTPNTPYGDPWQLVYVFDGDPETKVVCEGYSKAFQYLCDLSGIDCYTVTGTMNGGAHMWNIVPMDGQNYLVDVTNCDQTVETDDLFLVGATGSVNAGYTVSALSQQIPYCYNEDTLALYPESILTLAGSDYENIPSAGTFAITGMPATVTYGDTFQLSTTGSDPVAWSATGGVTVDEKGNVTVTAAGKFTITAKSGTDTDTVAGTAQKADPVAPTDSLTATYGQTLSQVELSDGWTWADPNALVGDVGEHTYKAVFASDENHNSGEANLTVEVTAKSVKLSVTVEDTCVYNGQEHTPEPKVETEDGTLLEKDTDYTLAYSNNTNAGTAEITIDPVEGSNYTFTTTNKQFTIEKATVSAPAALEFQYLFDDTAQKSYRITSPFPEDAGTLTYTQQGTDGDVDIIAIWSLVNNNDVSFRLKDTAQAGKTCTLKIRAASENYQDVVIKLVITLTGREVPEVSVNPYTRVYNGKAVAVTDLGKTAKVPGTWAFAADQPEMKDAGTYTAVLVFTPTDSTAYDPVTVETQVEITKKPVRATVTAKKKTYDGTTAAEVTARANGVATESGTKETITITGLTGTFAQKDVGDNLVVSIDSSKVQIENGENYEVTIPETATSSITPAKFTYTVENQTVRIGNGLATIAAEPEATGVAGETVTGTLTWYSDSGRTDPLDSSYVFAGTSGKRVTLYWTFTPASEETNYRATPLNGKVTLTLQGKETPVVNKGTEPKTKTYDRTPLNVATATEGVTVTDASGKTVEGTWAFKDADSKNLRNADTYAVDLIFTPKDTQNYNTVETSIQVKIEKRELTICLYLSTNRIAVGDELPEAKLECTGVAEGENAKIHDSPLTTGMPDDSQTAGDYTVKWTNPDNVSITILNGSLENYTVVAKTEAVLTITDAERLPVPVVPGQQDWQQYWLERSEMEDVPENLNQYESVDAIRQAMYRVACENVEGIWKENTLLWDLTLWYSQDNGKTWTEATQDNFPEAGITVTLPYPDGTNSKDYTFAVTHMLANGAVENCTVTETDNGVQFTVHSLSPVLLGWKDDNAPSVTPGGGSSTSTSNNTATSPAASGDSIPYYVCPACGYHNWTAAADGYHCDHCGYVESVKQLSGYGNVKGVYEPNAAGGSAAAASSVIPQTGDDSNPALWGLVAVVSVAVLGALIWFKRKSDREK